MTSDAVVRWFHNKLGDVMSMYTLPAAAPAYVLNENYSCDIITTSRLVTVGDETVLLPAAAWSSELVEWKTAPDFTVNGASMYVFGSFDELLRYLRYLRTFHDDIGYFARRANAEKEVERLIRHVDEIPSAEQIKRPRNKIYIS